MFIFRGWGFVVIPLAMLIGVLVWAGVGTQHMVPDGYTAVIIGGAVAAIVCWFAGRKLNDPAKDQIAIDKKTGKEIRIERRHDFMFIPIQYYAIPVFLVFAFIAPVALTSQQLDAQGNQQASSGSASQSANPQAEAQDTQQASTEPAQQADNQQPENTAEASEVFVCHDRNDVTEYVTIDTERKSVRVVAGLPGFRCVSNIVDGAYGPPLTSPPGETCGVLILSGTADAHQYVKINGHVILFGASIGDNRFEETLNTDTGILESSTGETDECHRARS